jgi:capsular exopolysaccharide synthesis family protein
MGLEYANQSVKTMKDVALSTGFVTLGSIPSFEAEVKAKGPAAEFKKIAQMIRGGAKPKQRKAERRKAVLDLRSGENLTSATSDDKRSPRKIELIASRKPQSIQAESYRSLRTTLLASAPAKNIQSIIFTSPLAGEGKSATVSNFGVTLAAADLKVVIVDSDLRKPKQHRIFNQDGGPGLTRFLSSESDPADLAVPTQIPNLSFISSGPHPLNPIELLSSTKMIELLVFLKRSFDYVLFDTPPILAVSDALALGSLVDGIILVCRGGHTPLAAMRQAKNKFEAHHLACMGVIINGVNLVEQDGYYAREYSRYSHMD